ncbi:hypothetical protein BG09_6491 [Bacillus thuringiensis serovar kurstaki str. HD-1]|nr:hypothetical protein BG09_6491 [Bacillus thuringiensis serovar kurstaki str. HD-1]
MFFLLVRKSEEFHFNPLYFKNLIYNNVKNMLQPHDFQ